jgi:hypothetical protein
MIPLIIHHPRILQQQPKKINLRILIPQPQQSPLPPPIRNLRNPSIPPIHNHAAKIPLPQPHVKRDKMSPRNEPRIKPFAEEGQLKRRPRDLRKASQRPDMADPSMSGRNLYLKNSSNWTFPFSGKVRDSTSQSGAWHRCIAVNPTSTFPHNVRATLQEPFAEVKNPPPVEEHSIRRCNTPEKSINAVFPHEILFIFISRSARVIPRTGGEDIVEWFDAGLTEYRDGCVSPLERGGGHEESGSEAQVRLVAYVCCFGVVLEVAC